MKFNHMMKCQKVYNLKNFVSRIKHSFAAAKNLNKNDSGKKKFLFLNDKGHFKFMKKY